MRYKYPRTYHFPGSPGVKSDSRINDNLSEIKNRKIVVTRKMDGENTTISNGYVHPRSVNGYDRGRINTWIINYQASVSYKIPDNIRICGENLSTEHSIKYDDTFGFLAFSVWKDDICLSWGNTKIFLEELEINHVKELYSGPFCIDTIKKIGDEEIKNGQEGIVIRNSESFKYSDFSNNVFKYRKDLEIPKHWKWG